MEKGEAKCCTCSKPLFMEWTQNMLKKYKFTFNGFNEKLLLKLAKYSFEIGFLKNKK